MATSTMVKELWGAWLLQGIIAVLFGVAAVFWPGLTLVTLVYLFGAFVLASGIVTLLRGLLEVEKSDIWFLAILLGIFETGVGVYLLRHPNLAFNTLILLIGFALIIRGVVGIVRALMEKGTDTTKMMTVLAGLAALVVGIFMLFQHVKGGIAFVWILGFYAILFGILEVAMAVDARKLLNSK
jgi:uncharacterized membrane protein HdeD (DUF308 family)